MTAGPLPQNASAGAAASGSGRPMVSILTAAFNAAPLIGETIASVIAQTFDDFEMLIVDDGSTDDTAQAVSRWSDADPRIRLLRQSNTGLAGARNAALAVARGRYMALLDSDDIWLPDYLARQLQILERRPDIAVLSANAYNLGGVWDGEPLLPLDPAAGVQPVSLLQLIDAEDTMSVMAVFRREVTDTIGAFDSRFRRSEDYDLWLRAAAAGFDVAINPVPLGLYRRRPDSLSSDEARMLSAIQEPLKKLRSSCADRPDIVSRIDAQLGRLVVRSHVAHAKEALRRGDMTALASHFGDLAAATGLIRYRVAGLLTRYAPASIRAAYRVKQLMLRLRPRRRRDRTSTARLLSTQTVSRAGS
jgi:hypothetical protein